jgi:uncharacterized membrane protein
MIFNMILNMIFNMVVYNKNIIYHNNVKMANIIQESVSIYVNEDKLYHKIRSDIKTKYK